MGTIARTVQQGAKALERLIPERKTSVGAQIPTWEAGVPQTRRQSYERYSLDGYGGSEIVYSCVEELATSAAEPRLVAVRKKAGGEPEQLKDHPVLELFEHPNPFMSRFQLIANLIMYRSVAGNAYLEMGRSGAQKVVELWPLRSDRMFVIPDEREHIRGWEYRLGAQSWTLPAEDVIHSRTRNPADDYYGLPPLAVCAQRVDTDALMRSFTLAFFHNAAVPAGLLNIKKPVTKDERAFIQSQVRGEAGGPSGWHQLLVLDATEAAYTQMGLPLGQGGIVLPELDEISEARIAMAMGVPLELIGARLGMVHGNRSTTLAARGTFWDETLIPLYAELGADFTRGLYPAYEGTPDEFDYLEFDLSTVKALAEDDDAKHKRVREDVAAGLLSIQEARVALGHDAKFEKDALLMLARGMEPMLATEALKGGPPTQALGDGRSAFGPDGQSDPNAERRTPNGNGKKPPSKEQLAALAQLAAGKD